MEKSLYTYILKHSIPQQVMLLLLIFSSYPLIYIGLILPKLIINDALNGGEGSRPIAGLEFTQLQYLVVLCMAFLTVVLIGGWIKYVVSVSQGKIGERLLRRLRYDLLNRVVRFSLPTFSKMPQGEVISMVTQEVDKLGWFMGRSIALPVFQGGILLTALTFLMVENYIMGLAALALYPVQIYLIPKLQEKVNSLEETRIRLVRSMAARIGETMSGAQEMHSHGATQHELAEYSHRLGEIFEVRLDLYKKYFFIWLFNTSMSQLGPFLFFLVGGYLVIDGDLTVGALVAMIGAAREMYLPWQELLIFYQEKEEAQVKFQQVVSQFDPSGMLSDTHISADQKLEQPLGKDLSASGLSYTDDNDNPLIEDLSLQLDLSKHTAIVGPSGNDKVSLTMILGRVLDHSRGQIRFDGLDARQLTESVTGSRFAYSGSQPHIFAGTLGDNLYFGLKHRPVSMREHDEPEQKRHLWKLREARLTGNSLYDINADWIDYGTFGSNGRSELTREVVRILRIVKLDEEVFQFGLRGTIDSGEYPEIGEEVLNARPLLRERLKDPKIAGYVELFDPEKYNNNASLAENLMFGKPVGDVFSGNSSAEHEYMRYVLRKAGLEDRLVEMGYTIASLMVELFSDMDGGSQHYQQFSFLDEEQLPRFQVLCSRLEGGTALGSLSTEERTELIALTFKLVPTRHRLDLIDDSVQAKIMEARGIFRSDLPDALRGEIEFFDPDRYNTAASLQDNLLFGKLSHGEAHAAPTIGRILRDVIEERGIYDAVINAGLAMRVGTGGMILSNPIRQKVGLARCLLKKPDILVLYHLFSRLESRERKEVLTAVLEEFKERAVIIAVKYPSLADHFGHILVLQGGRLVEQGSFADLNKPGTYFADLLNQEQSQT